MSQQMKVSRNNTSISTYKGVTTVILHSTQIVQFDSEKIILNTGGYFSATTKTRMNQASNQYGLGYYVYQKDGNWFVDYKNETITFYSNTVTLIR